MVFSLLRCLTGLEKPSQNNAEYINSGIGSGPSLVTSGPTLLGITMNSRLGTENLGKAVLKARLDRQDSQASGRHVA
jgi:hypothetical protein